MENSQLAGKTYGFDDGHNASRPVDHWFQDAREGRTLFLILYTQACRWSRCVGCNLPSQVSRAHVPYDRIMDQVDYVFDELLPGDECRKLRKIILSNNGSVLDEDTFSTTALLYFVAKMNRRCPSVAVLTLESRPEYIDEAELEVLARALREGATTTRLELAVGLEAFDERVRNDVFLKGLALPVLARTVAMAARHGFRIKAYFMLKPVPEMSEEEALRDVEQGLAYLDELARTHDAEINMHLNPTYVASGTPLAAAFAAGRFSPPLLETVRRAALASEGKRVSVFVGLNDEGLAVPGGSFLRPGDEALAAQLEQFNRTQDHACLR
ncbi:MAG: hypothetical protein HYV63_03000 [Candidatus Schekmanbacteria bacterium]|nr:hypothetical protein [Candidatus Schekmanbacteria bacterium]